MKKRAPELPWTIPAPGETFAGKYVIDGVCGRGGLAVVLSAMHPGLGQRVAIKMLLPEWASDSDVVERFLREGRAATRIKSQHVVRVFDVGTLENPREPELPNDGANSRERQLRDVGANGAPYLVLEYLEGHNLDDVISMWGPLQISTAIDWVLQACEAISEAHAVGILHRDLKPGNLFLTRLADGSDCIKVIDFGLSKLAEGLMPAGSAKLTRPNDVMGSPHYMAPEQLRAMRDADERTDLWALGAVLYELIAGKTPFRGESMAALCTAVLTREPEPLSALRPEVPPGVELAVQRCLAKDPASRFASAAELARALSPFGTALSRTSCMRIERVLEGRTSEAPPQLPAVLDDDWLSDLRPALPGTHTSVKVVLGSFLMLTGLGIGVFLWMYDAVHASDPDRRDVTAVQPRVVFVPSATPRAPDPAPPPSSSARASGTAEEKEHARSSAEPSATAASSAITAPQPKAVAPRSPRPLKHVTSSSDDILDPFAAEPTEADPFVQQQQENRKK